MASVNEFPKFNMQIPYDTTYNTLSEIRYILIGKWGYVPT